MKILLTVDADFAGYDPLYASSCRLNDDFFDDLIRTQEIIVEETGNHGMFLIHTSPFIRREHRDLFYTDEQYLRFWQQHVQQGGSLGLHPHEEEPDGSAYYYYYPAHITKVINNAQNHLSAAGLTAASIRFGYCAGNERLFPVLEKANITFLLDNMGGNFPEVYAWWQGAPESPYRPDYQERTRRGNADLWVIPIAFNRQSGNTGWRALIPEALAEVEIRTLWDAVLQQGQGPVTLLLHAFAVRQHENKIRQALRYITTHQGEWLNSLDETTISSSQLQNNPQSYSRDSLTKEETYGF